MELSEFLKKFDDLNVCVYEWVKSTKRSYYTYKRFELKSRKKKKGIMTPCPDIW